MNSANNRNVASISERRKYLFRTPVFVTSIMTLISYLNKIIVNESNQP